VLWLFVGCALLPGAGAAYLSIRSVTHQLVEQSTAHLGSLASAAGKAFYDRLASFESDLQRQAPALERCYARGGGRAAAACGSPLLYAADEIAWVEEDGSVVHIAGPARVDDVVPIAVLRRLEPGQSAVWTRSEPARGTRVYLLHHPAGARRAGFLAAAVRGAYLWRPADADALPAAVELAVWEAGSGTILGTRPGRLSVSVAVMRRMDRTATGGFAWRREGRDFLAAYWEFPSATRLRLPGWRVVISEPREDVVAPIAWFARWFPLLLVLTLMAVLGLGMTLIRRTLSPLAELLAHTRRVDIRHARGGAGSERGDEIAELTGTFNAMTAQLLRQFQALRAAGEIDRAVLSSVETGAIVATVLERLPEVCPVEGVSVTLLDPDGGSSATTWVRGTPGGGSRAPVRVELGPADFRAVRSDPERTLLGGDAPLPEFLAHFRAGDGPVEAYPLRFRGELLGVLALRPQEAVPAADHPQQMRHLADRVAVALSNARMVDQVRYMAFYDHLTRLPNRVLFKERLGQALARAERSRRLVAVCCVGLDHFARINETLGHDLGDRVLQEAAMRLVACCRRGDSVARPGGGEVVAEVARLGGDEFTVMLPDLAGPQEAIRVARRILESFQQPLQVGGEVVFLTASVGVAIHPFDGTDAEELLKHADVAMSDGKAQGPNTSQLYSASMNAEVSARLELEQRLRRAVEAGEFTIWYQPIVELEGRKPSGAEALVRWSHPERGLVSPGEFIGLCEECGLIVPLGEWILRTVCAQARAWDAAGLGPIRISVNLSARQLRHPTIVQTVHQVLEETGLRPRLLVLELTESMLMEPAGVTGRTIRELAALGVSLAIDDFGTGYSSLSYLKDFPVATLKIDRSFIGQVTTNPDDAAITTAIIALARAMELDVVAEGVELEEQVAFLAERGCEKMQGYLVGRPAPADAFEAYLRGGDPAALLGGVRP
jgi:diguanylate cyclase (GGDEF)-like protein